MLAFLYWSTKKCYVNTQLINWSCSLRTLKTFILCLDKNYGRKRRRRKRNTSDRKEEKEIIWVFLPNFFNIGEIYFLKMRRECPSISLPSSFFPNEGCIIPSFRFSSFSFISSYINKSLCIKIDMCGKLFELKNIPYLHVKKVVEK